jgi:hypothetical protein
MHGNMNVKIDSSIWFVTSYIYRVFHDFRA